MTFTRRQSHQNNTEFSFGSGDTLFIDFSKPFRNSDTYSFTAPSAKIDEPKVSEEIDQIRVVPNPYIVGHRFESPLPQELPVVEDREK